MALTDEQATAVKNQILKQIENFPEDKREQIRKYITEMNNEQLEEFMKKNQQMQEEDEDDGDGSQKKCIMCLISDKKIESISVYEDGDYLAVFELNPLSKGHSILIPKKHISDKKELPKTAQTLAKKLGKELAKKLSAEDMKISISEELGHVIINLIPIYKGEKIDKRIPAKKEELLELKEKIGEIKLKIKKPKEKKEIKEKPKEEIKKLAEEIIKLPRRIP